MSLEAPERVVHSGHSEGGPGSGPQSSGALGPLPWCGASSGRACPRGSRGRAQGCRLHRQGLLPRGQSTVSKFSSRPPAATLSLPAPRPPRPHAGTRPWGWRRALLHSSKHLTSPPPARPEPSPRTPLLLREACVPVLLGLEATSGEQPDPEPGHGSPRRPGQAKAAAARAPGAGRSPGSRPPGTWAGAASALLVGTDGPCPLPAAFLAPTQRDCLPTWN